MVIRIRQLLWAGAMVATLALGSGAASKLAHPTASIARSASHATQQTVAARVTPMCGAPFPCQ